MTGWSPLNRTALSRFPESGVVVLRDGWKDDRATFSSMPVPMAR